jgi:hypothetical protein
MKSKLLKVFAPTLVILLLISEASANSRAQAWQLHNRLAGVPPTPEVLGQMEAQISSGAREQAALTAMEHPNFYNVTLKNWVKSWTNEDQDNRVPFNDYVATVLGMIRDNIPFDTVLYGDHLYVLAAVDDVPPYSPGNNDHYRVAEEQSVNLVQYLSRRPQSSLNGISDTAGVLTTRAAGEAFFSAGTNRRMTRFTFMNFLCRDFEMLADVTTPDFYVRGDVERDPGGDSRTYRNNCVGCHAGQDALLGAWAYFDYVGGRVVHEPGAVRGKFNNPETTFFEHAEPVVDATWENLWHRGQNANLGWRGAQTGYGARELGFMLAKTEAFSQCMAQRAYEMVCLSPPTELELLWLRELAQSFEQSGQYNMRQLISRVAVRCPGVF